MAFDCAKLPPELLDTIANKIKFPQRLHPIPSRLQRLANLNSQNPIQSPLPAPMAHAPPTRLDKQPHCRTFFSLSNNKVHSLTLPEYSRRSRRCGSSHGWLAIVDESPSVFLLNPLSQFIINLPPLSSFPNILNFDHTDVGQEYTLNIVDGDIYNCNLKEMRDSFIKKVILSTPPSDQSNYIVLAIINQTGDLGYCIKGDLSWKFIDDAQGYCEDAIYFKRMFYAVNKFGGIVVCDVNGDFPRVSFINTPHQVGGDMQYLVACMDELLLVTRYLEFEFDGDSHQLDIIYRTTEFQVSKLDLKGSKW